MELPLATPHLSAPFFPTTFCFHILSNSLMRPLFLIMFFASLLAVGVNLLTLGLLFESMGFVAAGLGMALGNLANGGLLLSMYRGPESLLRHIDRRFLVSLCAASGLMAGVVLLSRAFAEPMAAGLSGKLLGALGPVVLGAGTYVGLTLLFRVPEATRVLGMIRQRLGR